MKFSCIDEIERQFEPLSSYLIRKHGFDPEYLAKDGLLQVRVLGLSFIEQMKWARKHGQLLTPSYTHFSRRYRKRCSANVTVTTLFEELEWIAVTDAFKHRKQSELDSKMDLITFISRLIDRSPTPELESLVTTLNPTHSNFSTGLGYSISPSPNSWHYETSMGLYFMLISNIAEKENLHLLHPSLLGFVNYVYVVSRV